MPNDKPPQSKLLKLKKWVTVPEAAKHLSIVFNEEVNEADVLRLALDGHLNLSVNFVNGTYVKRGKVVSYDEVIWFKSKIEERKGKHVMVMRSLNIDDERYINLDDKVTRLHGVWDLPMIGNEKWDIERKYQDLTSGPEVEMIGLDGAFIEGENNVICQLQEEFDKEKEIKYWTNNIDSIERDISFIGGGKGSLEIIEELNNKREKCLKKIDWVKNRRSEDNFYPAGELPEDSVLIVRTQALMDLVNSFSSEETDKGPFQFEVPEGTTWRGLRLVIRNNDLTEWLEVNGPEGPLGNFRPEAMGFRGHSGPGQEWILLTKLAETNGILSPRGIEEVKPTVSRLRKSFRELFPGIEGDPIPWDKREKLWRTAFPIELKRYEEE